MQTNFASSRRQSLGSTALAVGGLALPTWPMRAATTSFNVPASRLARLSSGANICRWFRYPRNENSEHFRNYVSESEAQLMAKLGLTHVRFCVTPKYIVDPATGAVREKMATFLEAAIQRLQRAGLFVVIDIHNEERAAELNPNWQEAFAQFWEEVAGRLAKFDPEFILFETIN